MNLLIVEDNSDIAANIGDFMEAHNYTVDFAMDGIGGLHLAITNNYDVIILDIMMPKMDGLTFCRKLREEGNSRTPVLMLTARDTLDDKLAGFDVGADDYLVKPFALQEVHARVNALIRRNQPEASEVLRVADLELDLGTLTAQRAGQILKLNPIGIKILKLLMQSSPKVVSHQDIEQALWDDEPPDSGALRSHMYALRRTVDKPFSQSLLTTVHGIGYRLVEPHDEIPA